MNNLGTLLINEKCDNENVYNLKKKKITRNVYLLYLIKFKKKKLLIYIKLTLIF